MGRLATGKNGYGQPITYIRLPYTRKDVLSKDSIIDIAKHARVFFSTTPEWVFYVRNDVGTKMLHTLRAAYDEFMRRRSRLSLPRIPLYCYSCGLEQRWCMNAERVIDWSPSPYQDQPLQTAGNTYFHGTPIQCKRCNKQLMTCPENAVCAFCDSYQVDKWWSSDDGFTTCKQRAPVAVDNHSADVTRNHIVDGELYQRPDRRDCRCQSRIKDGTTYKFHGAIAGRAIVLDTKTEKYKGIYGGFVMIH